MFDCTTSQEYIVRTDAEFTAPDGWEDAETAPLPDGYDPGYYFENASGGTIGNEYYTPTAAANAVPAQYLIDQPGQDTCVIISGPTQVSPILWSTTYRTTGDNNNDFTWNLNKSVCGASTSAACTTLPPTDTEWPTDSPAQLSYDTETQTWNTSSFDSNVAEEYKTNNASQIELCDSNGDVLQIQPSTNGGLVYTNANDNIFWVRGPDGKITAAGSGSARDMYVAK